LRPRTKNIAIAALDIGTSHIKLGVYCPRISDKIILLGSHKNTLFFGSEGQVKSDYADIRSKAFDLLNLLGIFLKESHIEKLFVGIGGHVSSLLEWNKEENIPKNNLFPMWLDSTSSQNMNEIIELTGQGKSLEITGSYLPPGTNWLLSKLINEKKKGFPKESVYLQVGDALFTELTKVCLTDFSSQVSMVHQTEKRYADQFLEYLGLNECQLPKISDRIFVPLHSSQNTLFSFSKETYVFPALADFYASFIGLRLNDREAFIIANTSEISGIYTSEKPLYSGRFMNISLNEGFIQYASSNTGGNIINWFFENILGKTVSQKILSEFTRHAELISPDDCPIFLPYLEGERTPFWDNKLTASYIGLKSFHTQVHLFRSLLESVSFARKQVFESMGIADHLSIKMGGGSTQNSLWNTIRASVLDKSLFISEEKELTIIGLIDTIIEAIGNDYRVEKPVVGFTKVDQDPALTEAYKGKYRDFITYQKQLNISYE